MSSDSPAPSTALDVTQLLGLHPTSTQLSEFISTAAALALSSQTSPEVKTYPDSVYFTYYSLGLSLLLKPIDGYTPKSGLSLGDLNYEKLVVDGIDIYNVPGDQKSSRKSKPAYSSYPVETLELKLSQTEDKDKPRPATMTVKATTTGKDFVSCMGEPDRKGGGAGPSSGSIGIWCEWSRDGVMVEFGGDESRGPQAWERGKDALWKVISIFPPKTE